MSNDKKQKLIDESAKRGVMAHRIAAMHTKSKKENFPTHLVGLWMENDEEDYTYFQKLADNLASEYDYDKAVGRFSLAIKMWVAKRTPKLKHFVSDLLVYAIETVDYQYIAKGWIDEAIENKD